MKAKQGGKVAQLREMREEQVTRGPTDPETFYAEKVVASLRKTAEAFIATGTWLIEAKARLPHGRWQGWIDERLPISHTTVKRLMVIAKGLGPKRADLPLLPSARDTLYDLARLDDDEWQIVEPEISPEMKREDLRSILARAQASEKAESVPRSLSEAAANERIATAIDQLPNDEHDRARSIFEQPGVPKVDAIEIAESFVDRPAEDRLRLYVLNESEDEGDRSLALTEAADRPPMPHRAIAYIIRARASLRPSRSMLAGKARTLLESVITDLARIETMLKEGAE